jgi:hypothetical protein|nr:MAG TPA: major capsid protein [Caudoviricetes sp.]
MTQEELNQLAEKVGKDAAGKIAKEMESYQSKVETIVKNQGATEEQMKEFKASAEKTFNELKSIAEKQGLQMEELLNSVNNSGVKAKTFEQVVKENESEIANVFKAKRGEVAFMVNIAKDGRIYAAPFDETKLMQKAAGITGTIDGLSGGGSVASIAQSIGAAELLRMGGNSPIVSQYRNSSYLMSLVNVVPSGFEMPFAMWIDEQVKEGSSANVAEGGAKPLSQYKYEIKTNPYKKESVLLTITDEFSLDLARLQSDMTGKAGIDLMNRIQSAVLANIKTAAPEVTDFSSFIAAGAVTDANEFDVIAALSAKIANDTYGAEPNASLLNTYTQKRMGILKSTDGTYLNPPAVISNIALIGNPEIGADETIVADFSQYNVIMRGGMIVRMGYNNDDFSKGRFSITMDQFYYDYISDIRKKALAKATLSTAKAAIGI